MLKTVVLLNIFVETLIEKKKKFRILGSIECKNLLQRTVKIKGWLCFIRCRILLHLLKHTLIGTSSIVYYILVYYSSCKALLNWCFSQTCVMEPNKSLHVSLCETVACGWKLIPDSWSVSQQSSTSDPHHTWPTSIIVFNYIISFPVLHGIVVNSLSKNVRYSFV